MTPVNLVMNGFHGQFCVEAGMSTWVKQAIMDKRMMVMFDSFGIAKGKVHGFQWKL